MTSENKMREAQEALQFILDIAASSSGKIRGEEQVEHCGNIIRAALHSVEAEKEPEWISCKDRLPESRYRMVIARIKGAYWPDYTAIGTCFDGKWEVNDSRVNGITGLVTHWMPIPAPPEHKPE